MNKLIPLSTLLLSLNGFAGDQMSSSIECAEAIANVAETARNLGVLQGSAATAPDRARAQAEIDLAMDVAKDAIRSAGAICK